ncbi:MAG: cell division FtsK/SpoIIIE [Firmicutes bacterium]|nr:cell division FtsK/SpoIIIE [Bacillota bacterium]
MSESSLLQPLFNRAKKKLAQALGRETPLIVREVIEALWDENRRPLIQKETKTEAGWDFVITLPPSLSHQDFIKKIDYFKDHTGIDNVEIKRQGKGILLRFIEDTLQDYYSFDWHYQLKGTLPIPIGYSHQGLVTVDLADIPHVLVAGTTGGGKSNMLHVWINSLLNLPDPPLMVVIDLKMSEFAYLKNHLALIVDADNARNMLASMVREMRRRQERFMQTLTVNIKKYNGHYPNEPMRHVVCVIDELGELGDKRALGHLDSLLRLSRSAGFCMVLATQRPSSTFLAEKSFGDLKANLRGRLALGVTDTINSKIILDDTRAANMADLPGRAMWKLGNKFTEIQTPYLDPESSEVRRRLAVMPGQVIIDESPTALPFQGF